MNSTYLALADFVLTVHVLFVLFVVFGLILIVTGGFLGWSWVKNSWFRGLHLLGIGVVIAQAWLGIVCPLTTLEMWFRRRAGEQGYEGSFIQYWLHRFLYYEAPDWVFALVYSLFGLLVFLAMFKFPPKFLSR